MQSSDDRILTTHVGSLPRVGGLADLLVAKEGGETVDADQLRAAVATAMDVVVRRQLEVGVDIGNDGEMPRGSFVSYLSERMQGFGRGEGPARPKPLDAQAFPVWFSNVELSARRRVNVYDFPQALSELRYDPNLTGVRSECDEVLACIERQREKFVDVFMTAVSPGFAATAMMNRHYDSHEAYVFALARELRHEYEYIVSRGFVLQIDAPDMGMERSGYFQSESLSSFISIMEMHVAALNEALSNIPKEQVRLHACWGNRDSPHYHDVPCPDILPVMYQASVGALVLPFANPRHQHEIDAFKRLPLPDHMLLVPGVIETTNNYVEHPQVVAERIERAARAVGGAERIIAGTDCGFGTLAGDCFTAEDVVWAKLESLASGARLADKVLYACA